MKQNSHIGTGGVQAWSAGPQFPWINTIVEDYSAGIGYVFYRHPDGRQTPQRTYNLCLGMSRRAALRWADRDVKTTNMHEASKL